MKHKSKQLLKHIKTFICIFCILATPTLAMASAYNMPLQPTSIDEVEGQYYVPSTLENIGWGYLPNRDSAPLFTVPSGSIVTFDTVSHEGILEDQGKDPVEYFGKYGVSPDQVLEDAKTIAASSIPHDFAKDGPHIVTGPVAIEGAEPGDVLKVEVLSLYPRVPYGVISNRHYKGALPGEFPENAGPQEGANAEQPELYNNVSIFTPIEEINGKKYGILPIKSGEKVRFPINPFMGIMGVAPNTSDYVNSIPPSEVGGNLDINELGVGSTLYLPIQVKGALFYTGDPHFAQGDGEVALTALEASLRATFRLTLLKKGDPAIPLNDNFKQPFAETKDYWIPVGLDPDLDEAMKEAVRESIEFLSQKLGMDRAVALAYLSAATDYEVSQVVDKTKGVHALIARMHFLDKINIKVNVNGKTITPLIFEDEVFVPIRSMSENLGGIVEWEGETQTILVKFKDKTITMKNNSNIYMLDGKAVYSKGGPIHTDNLTMVPITVISDILGANVTWSTSGVDVTANVMLLNSK